MDPNLKGVEDPTVTAPRLEEVREALSKVSDRNSIVIVARPKNNQITTERGSKYRGVSKNGKKWQVSPRT